VDYRLTGGFGERGLCGGCAAGVLGRVGRNRHKLVRVAFGRDDRRVTFRRDRRNARLGNVDAKLKFPNPAENEQGNQGDRDVLCPTRDNKAKERAQYALPSPRSDTQPLMA
jgi:hypothetical protein